MAVKRRLIQLLFPWVFKELDSIREELNRTERALEARRKGLEIREYAGRELTISPDDVFIVSYPKSGNTWVRFFIGNLISPDEPVTFQNVEQKVPDIYQNKDEELQKAPRPRMLKSHEPFEPLYAKVVYIVRDPRDVLVSYYHHQIKNRGIDESYPMDVFVRNELTNTTSRFGSWQENVESWLATRGGKNSFLLLRYEDMLTQPVMALRQVAEFIGVTSDEDQLVRVVELSDADRMRSLEREQSRVWRPTRDSRQDKMFVRSAKAGGWREEMSSECAELVQSVWGETMAKLGYI